MHFLTRQRVSVSTSGRKRNVQLHISKHFRLPEVTELICCRNPDRRFSFFLVVVVLLLPPPASFSSLSAWSSCYMHSVYLTSRLSVFPDYFLHLSGEYVVFRLLCEVFTADVLECWCEWGQGISGITKLKEIDNIIKSSNITALWHELPGTSVSENAGIKCCLTLTADSLDSSRLCLWLNLNYGPKK